MRIRCLTLLVLSLLSFLILQPNRLSAQDDWVDRQIDAGPADAGTGDGGPDADASSATNISLSHGWGQ